MPSDTANKAREQLEVPWDDVRAARVQREALEAFRARDHERIEQEEAAHDASGPAPAPLMRLVHGQARWLLAAAMLALLIGALYYSGRGDGAVDAPLASTPAASSLEFDDGSRSLLSEQAKLQVVRDEPERVLVEQSAGKVRYEVARKPTRTFQIEARGVIITVIGTVFDVTVDGGTVSVAVERGRVRVAHGERTVVLAKGERIAIDAQADGQAPLEEPGEASEAASDSSEQAAESDDASQPTEQTSGGGAGARATAAELMRKADTARAADRLAEAATALRKLVAEHPRDQRVTNALFTLGRIERQRGHHGEAARAFERCGNALQGDAIAEAASSWAAAGDSGRARAAARRYLRAFPAGVHADRMRSLGSP